MSNKIKQGDKIKVSENAPKLYAKGWLHDWCKTDSIVKKMDNEDAVIAPINRPNNELAIPTKYLVKVNAEAKEAKFKAGDRVRSKGYGLEAVVLGIDGEFIAVRRDDGIKQEWNISITELIEPTEQTEAEKKPNVGISEKNANEISDMLEAYVKVLSGIADSFDWQRYEADLAKEIVLKTVNSASDRRPLAIAEYATDTANAVVEGLKRR